jgi:hypothetical protein
VDVRIGEIESTVHATDESAALPPALIETIVKIVLARVRAEQQSNERRSSERLGSPRIRIDRY